MCEKRIMATGDHIIKDARVPAETHTGTKTTMTTEGVPGPMEVEVGATRVTDETTTKMIITSQNLDQW